MYCAEIQKTKPPPTAAAEATNRNNGNKETGNKNIAAQTFTFRELATATRNFRQECLIGEGGFGRVYKGKLEKTNQVRSMALVVFLKLKSLVLLKDFSDIGRAYFRL